MYKVWIKGHKLPIGAKTEETIKEITEAYGKENIVLIEEDKNDHTKTEYLMKLKYNLLEKQAKQSIKNNLK